MAMKFCQTFHAFKTCFEVEHKERITRCRRLGVEVCRPNVTFDPPRTFCIRVTENISGTAQELFIVHRRIWCFRFLFDAPTDLHPSIDGALHQDDLVLPTSRLEYLTKAVLLNDVWKKETFNKFQICSVLFENLMHHWVMLKLLTFQSCSRYQLNQLGVKPHQKRPSKS